MSGSTSYTFNGKAAVLASSITTTIKGAVFSDGSTLNGTWTANYDAAGDLLDQVTANFTVTSTSGVTTTFTSMGTLPYANTTGATSYEIHSLSQTGSGTYKSLYVDWKSENPSSLYDGTPSLYTSVINMSVGTTPLRLVNDGTTGVGSTPTISGSSSTESGSDNASLKPFAGVAVTDSDSSTTVSAIITLTNSAGTATTADGTLSGTGLTTVSGQSGTYSLSATSTSQLTSELNALVFTPTQAQVAPGNTVQTNFNLHVNDSDGSTSANTLLTETAACFLSGTRIATPDGARPVEQIGVGDQVSVLRDGILTVEPVRWVGRRHLDARAIAAIGLRPVRIRAGAFADRVPDRDLLVTPEHCLFAAGGLIPARMLVNGISIVEDDSFASFTYHHLELDRHGLLLADRLATESYLDTGHRASFSGGTVTALHPTLAIETTHKSWARDACAPLLVAREVVEPVWAGLQARALQAARDLRGPPGLMSQWTLSDDPELRVLLDDGRCLDVWQRGADRALFRIPRDRRPVALRSRSASPSELVGPFLDDRRRLGVKIAAISYWSGLNEHAVAMDRLAARGWHGLEADGRWTDGEARLDLPTASGSDTILDLQGIKTMRYPVGENLGLVA